jgi:glycosyltransferase involved in cell wall biosynthesis
MSGGVGVVAVVNEAMHEWVDSLRLLSELDPSEVSELRVCALDHLTLQKALAGASDSIVIAPEWNLSAAVASLLDDRPDLEALLLVTAPSAVPKDLLDRAIAWMRDDPRIATISFLSNAAGYLSFPYRNTPVAHGIGGHDEGSVTQVLRTLEPDQGPVPLPMPSGQVVLINRAVLSTVGGFDSALDSNAREAVAELALRASRRGFQHRLDAGTFVTAQWFEGFPATEACEDPGVRHRLHQAESSFPSVYDYQKQDGVAPLALAMDVARSKVTGLRILIDGSCLGPMEMGTQVQTLELVRALSRRPDIATVGVAVPNGVLPAYAHDLLHDGKIRLYDAHDLLFIGAEQADIIHRPFQPDRPIPWARWRSLAKRVVVTLQDLIAYRIGTYHLGGDAWLSYRRNIVDAAANADGIVAISEDTRASIIEERFNIASEQIFTVKNGGNHLDSHAAEETPVGMAERGLIASRFLLVLGASYAHKNRDLAIRVWQELRARGHQVVLVMAGAVVSKGSSRTEEAMARRAGDDLLVTMPDVSSGVRTWLLRHASVVLYPTSAEGFGLVPFEAAAMGTPTAHVSFGPLRELIDDTTLPREWSVNALADFTERLLVEPQAAQSNIAGILRSGASLTWDETANGLVKSYRASLARAPRA